MSRSLDRKVRWNFSKGLVTEANNLVFPEDAVIDCLNVDFNEDGSVERRKGLDTQFYGYAQNPATFEVMPQSDSLYYWRGTNTVVFVGGEGLTFLDGTTGAFLSAYNIGPFLRKDKLVDIDYAEALGGGLVIVINAPGTASSPTSNSINYYYTRSGSTVTQNTFTVLQRDMEYTVGSLTTRPVSPSNDHLYTLRNQGWGAVRLLISRPGAVVSTASTLSRWQVDRSDSPAISDDWLRYINSSDQFDVDMVAKAVPGTGMAPIGKHIVDVMDYDRASFQSGATNKSSGGQGFSTVEAFAGRVFYSGVNANLYRETIWYTQILQGTEELARCFQRNDPTSETVRTLLATDGGTINVPNSGLIKRIEAYQSGLVIFATKGIWVITGVNGAPFSATAYQVQKISHVPVYTKNSIVSVKTQPYFCTQGNVWRINLVDGTFVVENISDNKIKTLLKGTAYKNLVKGTGVYHEEEGCIYWFWDLRSLKYNLALDAFTANTYPALTNMTVAGSAVVPLAFRGSCYVGTELSGFVLTLQHGVDSGGSQYSPIMKYGTTYQDRRTNATFVDYNSYFTTGYTFEGTAGLNKQDNYVTIFSSPKADNSPNALLFTVSGYWDYGVTAAAAPNVQTVQMKPIELTGTVPKVTTVIRRLKFRGWGKSLQYRITCTGTNFFKVEGWAVESSRNDRV